MSVATAGTCTGSCQRNHREFRADPTDACPTAVARGQMIEPWQYVALGVFVAAVLAVLQYQTWRTGVNDSAFFVKLETTLSRALAAQQFVLVSKTHRPRSFGIRTWDFERSPRTVEIFWDGKDREIIAALREPGSPTRGRKRIAAFSIAVFSPLDHYQRVIDDLVDSIDAALVTVVDSPPALQ